MGVKPLTHYPMLPTESGRNCTHLGLVPREVYQDGHPGLT